MSSSTTYGDTSRNAAFFALINNPLKLKLYLFKNLPAAFFSGLKLVSANGESCTVSIPYKWFTKNPFRSTYFACLSMAAEFSTGVLAMGALYKKRPAVSLLVIAVEGRFYKKATGLTYFQCVDGMEIQQAIDKAVNTGMAQEVKAYAAGRSDGGELVAEFWITWSFKAKPSAGQ